MLCDTISFNVRTILIIILYHIASQAVTSIKCFTCSHHKGTQEKNCPTSSSDRTVFERDRYESVDAATYWCSIRVAGTGQIWHQGYTIKAQCNSTEANNHIIGLVNSDSGSPGAKFVCCNTDGCNWSLDTAISNTSILTTALPFIIAGIIALAFVAICIAVCCGAGCCSLCGCLGCCCCDRADRAKYDKNVNKDYQDSAEPSININERYRTIARPASEHSTATALTPVGSPLPGSRPDGDNTNAAGAENKIEVKAAEDSTESVVNVNANKLESNDGVPNPNEVENDRITRTARYYFQPAHVGK